MIKLRAITVIKIPNYIKLEDIYYDLGVANRAKYLSYDELQTAVGQKYLFSNSPYYNKYSYTERRAMYENELSMSEFGYCGNINDPRLRLIDLFK